MDRIDRKSFCDRAADIIQNSLDGFAVRKYLPSEFFELMSEAKRRSLLMSGKAILISRISGGNSANVREQLTGEKITQLAFPFQAEEVKEKVVRFLLDDDQGC